MDVDNIVVYQNVQVQDVTNIGTKLILVCLRSDQYRSWVKIISKYRKKDAVGAFDSRNKNVMVE